MGYDIVLGGGTPVSAAAISAVLAAAGPFDLVSKASQKVADQFDVRNWPRANPAMRITDADIDMLAAGGAVDITQKLKAAIDDLTAWAITQDPDGAGAMLVESRPVLKLPFGLYKAKTAAYANIDCKRISLEFEPGSIVWTEGLGSNALFLFKETTDTPSLPDSGPRLKGAMFYGKDAVVYGPNYIANSRVLEIGSPYFEMSDCVFYNYDKAWTYSSFSYIHKYNRIMVRNGNIGWSWPKQFLTSGEGITHNFCSYSNNNIGLDIANLADTDADGVGDASWGSMSCWFNFCSIDYNVQNHLVIHAGNVQENDVLTNVTLMATHLETDAATSGTSTARILNFGSLNLIGCYHWENDSTYPYFIDTNYPGRTTLVGCFRGLPNSGLLNDVWCTGNGRYSGYANEQRYGGDVKITATFVDRRADLQLSDARIQLATTTTPLIRDGVMYLATYPGVVTGTLANQAARQANYTALQAAADYADANGLSVHVERYTFQFEGGRTDANGVKLGLQFPKGCRGVLGSDGGGAIFAQYDPSHAGVTLGTTIAGTGQVTYNGYFKDWAVENRATATIVGTVSGSVLTVTGVASGTVKVGQALYLAGTISSTYTISSFGTGTGGTGTYNLSGSPGTITSNTMLLIETTTAGIIFGSHSNGHFERIGVSGFSATKPWVGAKFVAMYGFFSNILDGCRFAGGALSMLQYTLNSGTGCVWNNTYIGGGGSTGTGPGHYCVGPVVDIDSGGNNGIWNQLNVEWVSSSIIMRCRATPAQVFNSVHIEGCQLSGASPTVFDIIANSTPMKSLFNGIRLENVDIRSTGGGGKVSGAGSAVSIFRISGGACFEANTVHWFTGNTIAAGTYGTCDINLNLLIESGIVNGSFGQAAIRQFFISWSNSTFFTTSGIDLDATLPRGIYGIVNAFSEYIYNRGRSQTRSASVYVPVADTNFTTYGVHRLARIRNNSPITADRKIIISDKIAASGIGSTSPREPGDPVLVFRDAGCTGAFNLLVRDNTDTNSIATLAAASTEAFVSWNGTTVTTS